MQSRLRMLCAALGNSFSAYYSELIMVYHRTSVENAVSILRSGFRDSTGRYMTEHYFTGVWVSNVPLDVNEGR